jgi:predicted nucleic acid-binding protein
MFVLDASVALRWVLKDESTPAALEILERLADARALVPSHWWLDIGGALLRAQRLKRLPVTAVQIVRWLRALPFQLDAESAQRACNETLELATRHGLEPGHAAYLELALRCELPLASLDAALNRAARTAGVQLILPA